MSIQRVVGISGGQPIDPSVDHPDFDWPVYIARFRPWEQPISIEQQPLELIVDGYPENRERGANEEYKTMVHIKLVRHPKKVLIWEMRIPLVNLWEKPAMVVAELDSSANPGGEPK